MVLIVLVVLKAHKFLVNGSNCGPRGFWVVVDGSMVVVEGSKW